MKTASKLAIWGALITFALLYMACLVRAEEKPPCIPMIEVTLHHDGLHDRKHLMAHPDKPILRGKTWFRMDGVWWLVVGTRRVCQ